MKRQIRFVSFVVALVLMVTVSSGTLAFAETPSTQEPDQVYIFDLDTMREASPQIYASYSSWRKAVKNNPARIANEWDYAGTTVTCTLTNWKDGSTRIAAATIDTNNLGMTTISVRVRIYSSGTYYAYYQGYSAFTKSLTHVYFND